MRTSLVLAFALAFPFLGPRPAAAEPEAVRERFLGFSLTPPTDPRWSRNGSSRETMPEPLASSLAIWSAISDQGAHTAYLWVSADVGGIQPGHEEEFLRAAEQRLREPDESGRVRGVSARIARDSTLSRYGLRYQIVAEDRKVPGRSGTFRIVTSGLIALHPLAPCYVIMATFSERTPPGVAPAFAATIAEEFLGSLSTDSLAARPTAVGLSGGLQAVAATESAVWVTDGKQSLFRIDPSTLATVATVRVGDTPVGVLATEEAVWVANKDDGTVARVDAGTNTLVATVKVGKHPLMVAHGHGSVWVANSGSGSVSRIDPATNKVTRTISIGGDPTFVVVDDSGVWVSSFRANSITRIDPTTNTRVASITIWNGPNYLSASGGRVWAASQEGRSVHRIDTTRNSVATSIPLGFTAGGLAQTGDTLWVSDHDGGKLIALDAESGRQLGIAAPLSSDPVGLSFRGRVAWVVSRSGAVVTRLDF